MIGNKHKNKHICCWISRLLKTSPRFILYLPKFAPPPHEGILPSMEHFSQKDISLKGTFRPLEHFALRKISHNRTFCHLDSLTIGTFQLHIWPYGTFCHLNIFANGTFCHLNISSTRTFRRLDISSTETFRRLDILPNRAFRPRHFSSKYC